MVSCLQLRVTGCQFSCMIDTKLLSLKNSYNESSISSEIACSSNSSSSSSHKSSSGWSAYLEILYLLVKLRTDQSYHIFISFTAFSTTFVLCSLYQKKNYKMINHFFKFQTYKERKKQVLSESNL